jgi:hypothetical protein
LRRSLGQEPTFYEGANCGDSMSDSPERDSERFRAVGSTTDEIT